MSKRISFLFFSVLFSVVCLAGPRAQVTVLSTTDLHGRVYPINYFTDKPDNVGLAKLATLIQDARKQQPELLLIDVGDCIQGTPLVYHHSRKNLAEINPMMLAMNALRYTSMTVGNHEYNFGNANRKKAEAEAQFPWLSANTVKAGTREPAYVPYIIKEVSGVRVAILGLTTPGIPYWENPENYEGLEFMNPVETAKHYVPLLRQKELADVVIVAAHTGLDEELETGRTGVGIIPNENTALSLAREVEGIDVILMGHTHRDIPALVVNNTLLVQAHYWGRKLARVDIALEKMESGGWQILGRSSTTLPITTETPANPEILAMTQPYHQATQDWLSMEIGKCSQSLDARSARLEDSAIIDLIHNAQLEAGAADVSLAASFDPSARVPKGPVTVRDIYGLYTYENTLVVLEANGQIVKDILEHAARFFLPYSPGKTATELINHGIPGYSYDMAEGVSYEIDLTKPYGERIRNLSYKGRPLAPDTKLRLATNNYRRNGGGGYTMLKNLPVLMRGSREIRDLIIEWVEKHGEIPATPTQNWRILPLP